MRQFLIAIQFLTTLPVRIQGTWDEKDFKGILAYFPLVGACLGLVLALTAQVLAFMPPLAMVACVLACYVILTGALHIDGLADTCDGILSGRPKEKILEIMQDSRIGAMGSTAIGILLILKFAFVASLLQEGLWAMLIVMPVVGRWAQVLACCLSGYARADGKALYFFKYAHRNDIISGTLFSLGVTVLLLGIKGLFLFMLTVIPVIAFIKFVESKINGMTGDTVGATSEIAELAALFIGLIIL